MGEQKDRQGAFGTKRLHHRQTETGSRKGQSRKILNVIVDILYQANEVFRRAIDAIIHFGTEQHKSLFAPSEAADIKSVMQEYVYTTEIQKAVGGWLCGYAEHKPPFDEIKRRHTLKEVGDVTEGAYDRKIKSSRNGRVHL